MSKPRAIEVRPSNGGRLMTGTSSEVAGIANWTVKREWRRELEQEITAEGNDQFCPDPDQPGQPPALGAPITLIAMTTRPNGSKAVVVGTQTKLWRYFAYDEWKYVEDGYVDEDYVEEKSGIWLEIGSGFSANGRRWKAVSVNGYLVLNNSVDLPVTYRLEQLAVEPIYELREMGIASVGTISENKGVLVAMDVRQFKTEEILADVMNGANPYGPITDGSLVDRYQIRVIWAKPNEPRRWGAVVPCTLNAASDAITLDWPAKSLESISEVLIVGAGLNGGNLIAGVQRVNGALLTVKDRAITTIERTARAAVTSAQQAVTTATEALAALQSILTAAQAALAADPTNATKQQAVADATANVNTAQATLTAAQATLTTATRSATQETTLIASDAVGGITGQFEDLQGDGSAILEALTLRGNLVVYTETGIFIGTYLGEPTQPWDFEEVRLRNSDPLPSGTALYFRDTLIGVGATALAEGSAFGTAAHIYAGRNGFFRFDLTNRVPMEIAEFRVCQDTFFRWAKVGEVFATGNPVTREIWFCFPYATGPDKALRYDYRYGTMSTTGVAITAGAGVTRPEAAITDQAEDWFAMGTVDGKILRYGLVAGDAIYSGAITASKPANSNEVTASGAFFTKRMVGRSILFSDGTLFAIVAYVSTTKVQVLGTGAVTAQAFTIEGAIYHREGQGYDCILQSGMDGLGSPSSEKRLTRYTPLLGSNSGDSDLAIVLRTATNPARPADALSFTVSDPHTANMRPILLLAQYLGDRITVSGINNRVALSGRQFDLTAADSRGFARGP
jgi:hypothetical protein